MVSTWQWVDKNIFGHVQVVSPMSRKAMAILVCTKLFLCYWSNYTSTLDQAITVFTLKGLL